MTAEYGLFNDEGLMEGQFYSVAEAQAAVADRYSAEDDLAVHEVCPDHEGQARDTCEECFAEED